MKTNILLVVLITTLIVLIQSCSGEDELNSNSIQGEWNWSYTYGGFAGATYSPETENATRTLIISEKSYTLLEHDSILVESEYFLGTTEEQQIGTESGLFIEFPDGNQLSYDVVRDSFSLHEQCYDCFSSYYKRIK